MSKELDIPLLRDLISSGVADESEVQAESFDQEDFNLEIEGDDLFAESADPAPTSAPAVANQDHIEDYGSVQELLIEEEIRQVLDKHMEAAYEEIIRLINHKLA